MGNIVCLIGRLTRDVDMRYTKTGTAFSRFTVAIDRNYNKEKKEEEMTAGRPVADFIGCVCWGKTAELIGKYFNKGSQIALQGRIQTGSYEAQDGTRRYTTDVVVDRFEFIGNGGQKENQGNQDYGMANDGFPIDDDIPF